MFLNKREPKSNDIIRIFSTRARVHSYVICFSGYVIISAVIYSLYCFVVDHKIKFLWSYILVMLARTSNAIMQERSCFKSKFGGLRWPRKSQNWNQNMPQKWNKNVIKLNLARGIVDVLGSKIPSIYSMCGLFVAQKDVMLQRNLI